LKQATSFGQQCCLRAKISVDAANKALRDPVLYRCNIAYHHSRTGNHYKVYPTYDFACPIVDSIEGVTHALRTSEYHDRNDQYYWILEKLGLPKPLIWDYSRMSFVYTLLSKRKLQWFVDQRRVSGWEDPRFPTIRGLIRRGLAVSALKEYIMLQGPSKNTLLLEWDKLWAINKKYIDLIAPRHTALASETAVLVNLCGGREGKCEESTSTNTISSHNVPRHKKNLDLGTKTVWCAPEIYIEGDDAKLLKENEEVTLMDWGNAVVRTIEYKDNNDPLRITHITMELHLEGDFKSTERKLTWLAKLDEHPLTPVDLIEFDFLITKKKLEEDDQLEACLNENSEFRTAAWGDVHMRSLSRGTILQLERRGYFICDETFEQSGKVVLFNIPDGKTKSMSTLSTKVAPVGVRDRFVANSSSSPLIARSHHPEKTTASISTTNGDSLYSVISIVDEGVDHVPASSNLLYHVTPYI
jgi:glutamyl-tRNA synthetase